MTRWDPATHNRLRGAGVKERETVFLSGRLVWKAETFVIVVIPNAIVKAS